MKHHYCTLEHSCQPVWARLKQCRPESSVASCCGGTACADSLLQQPDRPVAMRPVSRKNSTVLIGALCCPITCSACPKKSYLHDSRGRRLIFSMELEH